MSLLTSAVSMTKAMVQIDSTDPGTYEKAMADWIEQQLSDLSNVCKRDLGFGDFDLYIGNPG